MSRFQSAGISSSWQMRRTAASTDLTEKVVVPAEGRRRGGSEDHHRHSPNYPGQSRRTLHTSDFTGTPISSKDRSTREVFGDYIDIYDMTQAVEDGATRPVYYESRVIHLKLDEKTLHLIDDRI